VTITPPTISRPPAYHEEQRFRQWWLWVLVIGPAALAWWAFIGQVIAGRAFGDNPAPDWAVVVIWLFIGIGLPLLFGAVVLVLDVTSNEIVVRFPPFRRRTISITDIVHVEARKYDAVKEYGGWGVKGWSRNKVAYNVSGDRGVELALADGRRVMLGSQRADELAAAIEAQRRAARSSKPRDGVAQR
jgi:hypothetical protein